MSADTKPDPTAIGPVSDPPFAVLPDPATLFPARTKRLRAYAAVSPLKPYLDFLAGLTEAQSEILPNLPAAAPDAPGAARAASHGMPALDLAAVTLDAPLTATLDALFAAARHDAMPPEAAAALGRVAEAGDEDRGQMVRDVLDRAIPVEALAEHVFVAAALQVHLARLAAGLDAVRLAAIGDGVCPACGGPPLASLIVEWPNAHGSRYCVCALCATRWNFVRIRCCACGTTKGIGYQEIQGGPGTIKAETCDECRTYTKVFYQNKDPAIEALADDVGSLALDLMMRNGPYRRAAFNPFLLGT